MANGTEGIEVSALRPCRGQERGNDALAPDVSVGRKALSGVHAGMMSARIVFEESARLIPASPRNQPAITAPIEVALLEVDASIAS